MLEYILATYSYPAIFIGTALEGEIVLLAAGFLAYLGFLSLPGIMFAGFLGSVLSDQFFFWLGRTKGKLWIDKREKWRTKAEKVHQIFDRHRIFLLLTFRFFYGFRVLSPFVIGMSNISRRMFIIFNIAGAAVWSVAISYAGYFLGSSLEVITGASLRRYELHLVLGIIVSLLSIWLLIIISKICYGYVKVKWMNR